jgi:hypothetical protein
LLHFLAEKNASMLHGQMMIFEQQMTEAKEALLLMGKTPAKIDALLKNLMDETLRAAQDRKTQR